MNNLPAQTFGKQSVTAHSYTDGTYAALHPQWHLEDAPFKAREISRIIDRNHIDFQTMVEAGCGVGGILGELRKLYPGAQLAGFDIAADAIERAQTSYSDIVFRTCGEGLAEVPYSDLLLVIDVFEHVPNYMAFCSTCKDLAKYKIYHIPLDINCVTVACATLTRSRRSVGHLHVFTKETAIATLEDTGHRILDWHFTPQEYESRLRRSFKGQVIHLFRRAVGMFSVKISQRVFGGWSLMVLAE